MDFQISVDIAAPPDVVWAVMADAERWHEWTPSVRGIRLLDSGPLRVGSRALIRQPKFPPAITNRYLGFEAAGLKRRSEERTGTDALKRGQHEA